MINHAGFFFLLQNYTVVCMICYLVAVNCCHFMRWITVVFLYNASVANLLLSTLDRQSVFINLRLCCRFSVPAAVIRNTWVWCYKNGYTLHFLPVSEGISAPFAPCAKFMLFTLMHVLDPYGVIFNIFYFLD